MRKISNPLTIIGIFAGIAEVSGTIVLPLVSPDLQYIFIWYVMGFPTVLVAIFFITLNFNSKSLYAPGDFSNEENYMKLVNKKIEEVKIDNPDLSDELENVQLQLNASVRNNPYLAKKVLNTIKIFRKGLSLAEISNELDISHEVVKGAIDYLLNNDLIDRIYEIDEDKTTTKYIAAS